MPIRLPPIGFWSYARQDDEASEGRLSGLRSVLRAELQTQYGRESIMLFQDVAAIVPGAEWEAEIRKALDRSTFFIPIITPNFVESEWCMREVQLFLNREAELNAQHPDLAGKRRIFPIVYVPIDNADPFDPAVITELRKLQWFDFSNLRFKDHHDETVRAALSRLANSVCQLISLRVEDAETIEQRRSAEEQQRAQEEQRRSERARTAQEADERAKQAAADKRAADEKRETERRLEAEEKARLAALERKRREEGQQNQSDPVETPRDWKERLDTILFQKSEGTRKPKPALYGAAGGVVVLLLLCALAMKPDPNAVAKKALKLVTDKDWSITSSTDITTKVLGVATLQQMETLAQTQNVKAEAAMGLAYYSGSNGVKSDNVLAGSWFHKAADQKFPRAYYNIGDAYAFGNGVSIDKSEAFRWFKLGAVAGNALAQYQLGMAYINGDGVTTDRDTAFRYVKMSSDQGYAQAQSELGFMYHAGWGTPVNEDAAQILYHKAADGHVGVAEFNVGYDYSEGVGVPQDKAQAAAMYQRAMDHGYNMAGFNLGLLYWEGEGVQMDRVHARVLINKAADAGDTLAKNWLVANPETAPQAFGSPTTVPNPFVNQTGSSFNTRR